MLDQASQLKFGEFQLAFLEITSLALIEDVFFFSKPKNKNLNADSRICNRIQDFNPGFERIWPHSKNSGFPDSGNPRIFPDSGITPDLLRILQEFLGFRGLRISPLARFPGYG